MEQQRKVTYFVVDQELCVGCGLCVTACPMKILAVQDEVCVMTDPARCLECRTCMRDCPKDAIRITDTDPGSGAQVLTGGAAADAPEIAFTPILEALQEQVAELNPRQLQEFQGIDVRSLNDFKLEGQPCYYRVYTADKLEKLGISSMNFYGSMRADVMIITPAPEYDIPYYVIDWDESEEHIFFICDLMPSDDPGRNADYLQHYLYEPLEELYQEYSTIPGLNPSVFHWVRAVHSPYIITGTVAKSPARNVDRLFSCAVDYLKVWKDLYRQASPQDTTTQRMRFVHERRKTIRALYKENDPGVGALNKFLGDELADISLTIIEP